MVRRNFRQLTGFDDWTGFSETKNHEALSMIRLTLLGGGIIICTAFSTLHADDKDKQKGQNKVPPGLARLLSLTPEEFIKRFDKNKDGFLTKDELPPRLAAIFERADQNKDGKLDANEVDQMLRALRQRLTPDANKGGKPANNPEVGRRVDEIFTRLDTNKDGKISRDEAKGPLQTYFDQIDVNKDGFLDKAEVRRAVERFLQQRPQDAGKSKEAAKPAAPEPKIPDFDSFDLDADGRLSREELSRTPYANRFDEMDTNKDGKIDRKEFEAFFKKEAEKESKSQAKEQVEKKP
jgi:Ca2+-binding EF-hand superfamily protein